MKTRRRSHIYAIINIDPKDRNAMTYIGSLKQIDAGQNNRCTASNNVEGVIKAMAPSLKLKKYLESMQKLTLKDLKEVLKAYYGQKARLICLQNKQN